AHGRAARRRRRAAVRAFGATRRAVPSRPAPGRRAGDGGDAARAAGGRPCGAGGAAVAPGGGTTARRRSGGLRLTRTAHPARFSLPDLSPFHPTFDVPCPSVTVSYCFLSSV